MTKESAKLVIKPLGSPKKAPQETDRAETRDQTPGLEDLEAPCTLSGFPRESDILDGVALGRSSIVSTPSGSRVGAYEVGARIGRGMLGPLYRAQNVNERRAVTIETLPSSMGSDEAVFARLKQHVASLTPLGHPNVGRVLAAEDHDGLQFLVIEAVEGETLAERLERGPKLSLEEAAGLARQVAGALDVAHGKGIVHRSLTPRSIRVTNAGFAKVFDFGLSTVVPRAVSRLNSADDRAYLAPEQSHEGPSDRRADIWSFGVIFYQMLTGRRLPPACRAPSKRPPAPWRRCPSARSPT